MGKPQRLDKVFKTLQSLLSQISPAQKVDTWFTNIGKLHKTIEGTHSITVIHCIWAPLWCSKNVIGMSVASFTIRIETSIEICESERPAISHKQLAESSDCSVSCWNLQMPFPLSPAQMTIYSFHLAACTRLRWLSAADTLFLAAAFHFLHTTYSSWKLAEDSRDTQSSGQIWSIVQTLIIPLPRNHKIQNSLLFTTPPFH